MIRPVRPDGTIETGGVFVPILRRRVVERIVSAARQRVVLIIAPAGYGKSVALHQYLDTVREPYVRYDVLPDNATLLGFLRGLADALGDAAPDARATLAGAYEKNAESPNPGVDLAMWMHSHLSRFSGTIAIDDLHVAQGDREVTRFLASLIERTRGRVQWIIASRSSQGLPIGTWLAYGESDLAIDELDLKFVVEEAKEAARAFRLGVRDEELHELLALTDGWATAMSFALRSSTRSVDLRGITTMTREMIYRYLAEQVYGTLEEAERAFIETAALLPQIDLDVMIAAGFDRAAAMVQDLRERSAFIQEPQPGTYRLHDLFRDFVLHQRDLRGSAERRASALSVGTALEHLGRMDAALRMYVAIRDADTVKRLLTEQGTVLVLRGFADDVWNAVNAGLGDEFDSDAAVLGMRGYLELMHGNFSEGERLMSRALRGLGSTKLGSELLIRLASHLSNQRREPIVLLEEALRDPTLSERAVVEIRSQLAVSYVREKRVAEAFAMLQQIKDALSSVEDDELQSRLLNRIGSLEMFRGDYDSAKGALREAVAIATKRAQWSIASKAHLNLSLCALFGEADISQSLARAQAAAAAAERAGDFFDLQSALLAMLSLETRRGDADQAAHIEKRLAELRSNEAHCSSFIVSSQAHRHAWARRFTEAHRLFGSVLDRQAHAADRALVRALHAFCLAMDGNVKTSTESVQKALATVELGLDAGEGASVMQFEMALLFAVVAEVIAGRLTSAQRIFKRDVQSSSPVTNAMRAIVEAIVRTARSPSYSVENLDDHFEAIRLAGFGGYANHLFNALRRVTDRAESGRTVELTPSELRIIRYLANGMTPKDIATEMGRSVYTVQTHIQNLTEKLGCHGRAEAIAVARQLGYLVGAL